MALFSRLDPGRSRLPKDRARLEAALEAVLGASEMASSARVFSEAVQSMVRSATDLLGAEQGSIMLLDQTGGSLVLTASSGLPSTVPLGHVQPVGESVAGQVMATGRGLLLDDVSDGHFVNFVPKERAIVSSVVVPLRSQGRAIGVLSIARCGKRTAFDEDDLKLAQLFADQSAGVIHRARLHEQAERRSSDLMALVDSSRGLVGTIETESLLQQVLNGACRLAGSQTGFACLFEGPVGKMSQGVFRGLDKAAISSLLSREEVRGAVEDLGVVVLEAEGLGTVVAAGISSARDVRGAFVVVAEPQLASERIDLFRAFQQQCTSALGVADLHAVVLRKESELSAIIQAVPNPIVMVDAGARVVALNAAAEELFGMSAAFSAGAPLKGALGHHELESLLASSGDLHAEVSVGNPARTYKARVVDVRLPGAPLGRVLIMDDVTAEREISRVQRDFVAMVGHELRTPLTIIKGFGRTLLRRLDSASREEMLEALTTMDARASHLERLIEDLLYVSGVESREAVLKLDEVDVAGLIGRVTDEVVESFRGREVRLEVPAGLQWPCDEAKITLVLRHLLENALKYSEAGSPVVVRASASDDELQVDVVDRGAGLLSSDIPHIFERFHQVDSSSTREHGGTGVGLYLCSQLIRMHRGRIWVDSAWGKGSTFSFALSRKSAPTQLRSPLEAAPPAAGAEEA
jgi:two-component system, OmpR family, phosphate regulon sensor histidine kinase PhoR